MQAKVLDSIFDTELLTEGDEHVVIGWFTSEEDEAYKLYQKVLALSLLCFLSRCLLRTNRDYFGRSWRPKCAKNLALHNNNRLV
jgi:hypothetical protein